MTNREQKFVHNWEKIRKKGVRDYSLKIGVTWGIFTAFISALFDITNKSFAEIYFNREFLIRLLIFLIIGFFLFSRYMFKLNENKYFKLLKKLNESNS